MYYWKKAMLLSLGLTLTVGVWGTNSSVVRAATSVTKKSAVTPLKTIFIGNQSSIELLDANLMPSENGSSVSFTINFYNGGTKDVQFIDYWARLSSKKGSTYSLRLTDDDQKKKKIAAKTSQTYTFYGAVGASETLDNLILNMIKFDFGASGYERTIAQFNFPKGYNGSVKLNGFKPLYIKNAAVNSRIDKATISKTSSGHTASVKFVFRNTSKYSVPLPQYDYYVQTSEGILYKMILNTKTENMSLDPMVLKTINMTASIPENIGTENCKLLISQSVTSVDNEKLSVPVASYQLPVTVDSAPSSSKVINFTNGYGTYEAELQSVERLPWQNNDTLIAEVIIRNEQSQSLPLPTFVGQFTLDNNVRVEAKAVQNKSDIGLAPGAQTTVYLYGLVPLSYQWSSTQVLLEEKGESENTQLAEFNQATDGTSMPVINTGSSYTVPDKNRQVSVSVDHVRTYTGSNSDTIAASVTATNKQSRNLELNAWTGFFKTSDGSFYQAKLIKGTGGVNPTNKEQFILWADIPKNLSKARLQLIIGEAIGDTGFVSKSDEIKGYVNAAQFELPADVDTASTFAGIHIGPYTVDVSSIVAFLDDRTIKLSFAGDVKRDTAVDVFASRKFNITIEDPGTGNVVLSEDFELENTEASHNWTQGTNYTEIRKELTGGVGTNYMVTINELINGKKKKLVSKSMNWSPYKNWADPNVTN